MRAFLVTIALVGCSNDKQPDIDAAIPIDAAPDAPLDAAPDAPAALDCRTLPDTIARALERRRALS